MMQKDGISKALVQYRAKYHRLETFRGAVLWISWVLLSLAALATVEYYVFLSSAIKTWTLLAWAAGMLVLGWYWFFKPMFAWLAGWRSLSDLDIARRIGQHDPEVEDRLINLLQLKSTPSNQGELVEAIYKQREKEFAHYSFLSGLTWSRFFKALITVSAPVVLLMGYVLLEPDFVAEGPSRLLNYNTTFTPKAPFDFISEATWTIEKGDPLLIELTLEGEAVPDRAFVWIADQRYPLQRKGKSTFELRMDRWMESAPVQFEALGFRSDVREIEVLEKPALQNFIMDIIPPKYTGVSPFSMEGTGDASFPQGSTVQWRMNWMSTDSVQLESIETVRSKRNEDGSWISSGQILANANYRWLGWNDNGTSFSSGVYALRVIPDRPPSVDGQWSLDSVTGVVYASGWAEDDYGVSDIVVILYQDNGEEITLPVQRNGLNWSVVLDELAAVKRFAIRVRDNNAVTGIQSKLWGPWSLDLQSREDIQENLRNQSESRIRSIESMERQQSEIREQRNRVREQLIEGTSAWERERAVKKLEREQRELMEQWDQVKEDFQKENEEEMLRNPEDEELMEKRRELQERMEEMNTERLEELMKELEEERENMNDDYLRDWMRRVERENNRLERDLDRLEELLKRFDFEQNVNESIRQLEQLQQRQQELSQRSDDTQAEQDSLNTDFNDWKNNLDSLSKQNGELESPMSFDSPKDKAEETSESMEQSSESLQNQDSEGANESQENSSQQMEDMMEQMSSSVMSMQMQMHVENLASLRRTLSNLIHLSVDQEGLDESAVSSVANDAVVVSWMRTQRDLLQAYQLVDDSLTALVNRIPQIAAHVTEWMEAVDYQMESSNERLSNREILQATANMRESMRALNELSLMLDITMDQIQAQMSSMMQGKQNCQKPGGGKPSMSGLKKMQQQLSQEMQQMGQQPGSGTPQQSGENGQSGEGGMSQRLVEMMARQAQIRQMLQEQKGSTGNNGSEALEELMEENERDLSRRNFDADFMERQREIEVKMLELEAAEREQEQDNQRESETGQRYQEFRDSRREERLKELRRRSEELRFESPQLMPYYQERIGSYLRGR